MRQHPHAAASDCGEHQAALPTRGLDHLAGRTAEVVAEKVALYDVNKFVILPFTVRRRCAFVEMVARAAQSPRWFVSHWWGEPAVDFVACLEQHAQDYGRDKTGRAMKGGVTDKTPCWVCAYANNQWDLSEVNIEDPGQTSFHKAMALAEGTVTVLDKGGVVFTRIWCGYEVYVSLASPPNPKVVCCVGSQQAADVGGDLVLTPYTWVVYTALEGVVRAEPSSDHEEWEEGDRVRAVGVTDGNAPCDEDSRRPSSRVRSTSLSSWRTRQSATSSWRTPRRRSRPTRRTSSTR